MRKVLIIILLLASINSFAQWQISPRKLTNKFVLSSSQANYDSTLRINIKREFTPPLTITNLKTYNSLFYQAALYYIKMPEIQSALKNILINWQLMPESLVIRAIITAHVLYPNNFSAEIDELFHKTTNYKLAIYSLFYLRDKNHTDKQLLSRLTNKFHNRKNILLQLTTDYLQQSNAPQIDSSLYKTIFSKSFLKKNLVIYTFLRHNRKIPGLTVVRKPNGEFVLNKDSSLFAIPQLGYSVTNLPYFLLDGNSPQGLYSFQGFYNSHKLTIGPTPALILRLPFETTPVKFSHGKLLSEEWNLEAYFSLLPKMVRKINPYAQTYFAGKLGRNKLVLHGSTDNPKYYSSESYFPLTPTTGCLSSVEIWDNTTGKIQRSDQLELVNAILRTGTRKGYLFLLELNDSQTPVSKDEIKELIKNFSN